MAYTAGNTILDDEYNSFATGNIGGTANNANNNVNTVNGAGALDRGYGQSGNIVGVTAGTVISATQWSTMLNKITTLKNHQGSTITAITNPVATNTIAAFTALTANIVTITTNRNNAAASGTPITAGGASSRTTAWNGLIDTYQTVTFASSNHMRYFFNAGGRISISWSRTGGSVTAKNTGWTNLCAASGTVNVTGTTASKTIGGVAYLGTQKIGGSGTYTAAGTGVNSFGGAEAAIFKQFDVTYLYTANFLQLNAYKTSTVVTLRTMCQDDANLNVDENIDGTLTATVTVVPPSTTYIANTWGTPTIATSNIF